MSKRNVLVWFRNDLRLHDNAVLHEAIADRSVDKICLLYVFDTRQIGGNARSRIGGFYKCDARRAQFQLQAVENLRSNISQKLGGRLVLRTGHPEKIIPEIMKKHNIQELAYSKEVTSEEVSVERSLCKALGNNPRAVRAHWTHTLVHLDDLPNTWGGASLNKMPDVYTNFRKQLEGRTGVPSVRSCFAVPAAGALANRCITTENEGQLPTLQDLGYPADDASSSIQEDQRSAILGLKGGEDAALARLQDWLWQRNCLKDYKDTRNGMIGLDYSSKFSLWLANGCISARHIFHEIQRYESLRVKNDSTYWLVFELLWRDFFRFLALKLGTKIFKIDGIRQYNSEQRSWSRDMTLFNKWAEGKTGHPLVDACMRELNATGWMSNRGRQNVCSYLTKDLKIDWRLGAEYFESKLLDYDVSSNWLNWMYGAGVGNDPRGDSRYFNIIKQGVEYDPQGLFAHTWLPELSRITDAKQLYMPWTLTAKQQQDFGCVLGRDYPMPLTKVATPAFLQLSDQGKASARKQRARQLPQDPRQATITQFMEKHQQGDATTAKRVKF